MRSPLRPSPDRPVHRISGPVELLDAVPYLLGFHPHDSLVLIGLREKRLVVTARIDLADAGEAEGIGPAVRAMARGGAATVVLAAYPSEDDDGLERWRSFAAAARRQVGRAGCELGDALLVRDGRWWSLTCEKPECCPPEGRVRGPVSSPFAAQATFEGVVPLPDRAAVEAQFDPLPDAVRDRLDPLIALEERAAVRDVLRGQGMRRERSLKRALFAAARSASAPPDVRLSDEEAVRFGVGLSVTSLRDAVWLAIDGGRLDGRPLWRELGRRLPAPYDAPPLFLYGWAAWRAGEGAQAGMAAERAVRSDPGYTAADLLMAAVTSGLSPHTVPRLRKPA
ncbi:MAG TPA: DUF4192 domain-containing protein [Jatrophihabitans sp.]|nr:DUF4192 domain-containing protein [Jatrophihabitans sp.]